MQNPICYWFGCVPDYEHPCAMAPNYVVPCSRCSAPDTDYADRVGDTRHRRAVQAAAYWFWRRWLPVRCPDCRHRYGSHAQCDVLPF